MGRRLDTLANAIQWYKTLWVGSMMLIVGYAIWPLILLVVFLPFVLIWGWWNAPPGGYMAPDPAQATQVSADAKDEAIKRELNAARNALGAIETEGHSLLRARLSIEDAANEALRQKTLSPELSAAWSEIRNFDSAPLLRESASMRTELDSIEESLARSSSLLEKPRERLDEISSWAKRKESSLRAASQHLATLRQFLQDKTDPRSVSALR